MMNLTIDISGDVVGREILIKLNWISFRRNVQFCKMFNWIDGYAGSAECIWIWMCVYGEPLPRIWQFRFCSEYQLQSQLQQQQRHVFQIPVKELKRRVTQFFGKIWCGRTAYQKCNPIKIFSVDENLTPAPVAWFSFDLCSSSCQLPVATASTPSTFNTQIPFAQQTNFELLYS